MTRGHPPDQYPWSRQILRHMRLSVDVRDPDRVVGTMPLLPDMVDPGGALRLGAAFVLVDFQTGLHSAASMAPDAVLTQDAEIHLVTPHVPGAEGEELTAVTTVLRQGRQAVVTEARASVGDTPICQARVTYTRADNRGNPIDPAGLRQLWELAETDEAERLPLDELLGLRLEPERGVLSFDHIEIVKNRVKAIQGGVIGLVFERAASMVAEHTLGGAGRTLDFTVQFLALAKVGPFEVRTELLRTDASAVRVRCALVDTGNDDRLLAIGSALAATTS